MVSGRAAPTVYLSYVAGGSGTPSLAGSHGVEQIPEASAPALLVSFVYLKPFIRLRPSHVYREWMLDSGAFTASMSGATIDLDAYIATAKLLLAEDPTLTEVLSLDVIGNWREGVKNVERMWTGGVPAIPTWHAGEPEDLLRSLARDYPKIAIGGLVPLHNNAKWRTCERAFAKVWPKKIHGLGCGGRAQILGLPWHSTDAANWVINPCKYGQWQGLGSTHLRSKGPFDLRVEIEHFLKLERAARTRWRREMKTLEEVAA
jgi:hypothetical protein